MSANDIKIRPVVLHLDRPRNLVFDLNALEELEEIYGDLETAFGILQKDKKRIKHIKNFIYAGLTHEDQTLTPNIIGTMIGYNELIKMPDKIWQAINQSLPEPRDGSESAEGET